MINLPHFFASSPVLDIIQPGGPGIAKSTFLTIGDIFLIVAAALTLTFLIVLLILFLRKSKRHHHHHHRRRAAKPEAEKTVRSAPIDEVNEDEDPAESHQHRHHRRRVKRKEHRGRNPTLAETGGLPPVREENKPPFPV